VGVAGWLSEIVGYDSRLGVVAERFLVEVVSDC